VFTIIAVLLGLCLFPFALGPALPFHMITEEKRYLKQKQTSSGEKFLLYGFGIIFTILLFLAPSLSNSTIEILLYIMVFMLVMLSILCLYIIGISLVNKSSVIVLGVASLTSKTMKFGAMAFFIIIILAVLENLNVVPTKLW
jgi:hypothetical protein